MSREPVITNGKIGSVSDIVEVESRARCEYCQYFLPTHAHNCFNVSKPVPQNEQKAVCHMCGDPEDHLMGGMPTCINCDTFMGMLTFPEVPRGVYPWIARVQAHCAKLTNAALSQPVPQGEQSLPPQLVSDERITALVIHGGACGPDTKAMAKELQQLRAYVSKLQTELLDTKRALELAAKGARYDCHYEQTRLVHRLWGAEDYLAEASDERKGQQNG